MGAAGWPRAFVALWAGQTVSSVGSQLSLVAIPLVAVLTLHAGPAEMAILGALETAPFVVLVLPAGVVADRADRRLLLIACDVGRAVALLVVALAFAAGLGSLAWLCVASIVVGGLSALFTVAQQAYLPDVVSPDRLIGANQRLEISESGARVVGPGLAGVVVAAVGGIAALVGDAASYVVSGAFLALAGPGTSRRPARAVDERPLAAVARGVRFVVGDPALRWLLVSTAIFNLGTGMMLAQLVLFATDNLALGAAGFGAFQALGNLGFVIGAVAVDRLERRLGTAAVLGLSASLGAFAMVLVALSGVAVGIPLLLLGRLAGAFATPLFNVTLVTVRQTRSPDDLQARVAATFRAIDWGTAPLGALASGVIGLTAGTPAVMSVAAIIGAASVPYALLAIAPLREEGARVVGPGSSPAVGLPGRRLGGPQPVKGGG